jgi:hypothetical protein
MDGRRARNHSRDRRAVLAAMPSMSSWHPAPTTEQIITAVGLPRRNVLHLLHEVHVDRLADEAGGRWRRRGDLPPPPTHPDQG